MTISMINVNIKEMWYIPTASTILWDFALRSCKGWEQIFLSSVPSLPSPLPKADSYCSSRPNSIFYFNNRRKQCKARVSAVYWHIGVFPHLHRTVFAVAGRGAGGLRGGSNFLLPAVRQSQFPISHPGSDSKYWSQVSTLERGQPSVLPEMASLTNGKGRGWRTIQNKMCLSSCSLLQGKAEFYSHVQYDRHGLLCWVYYLVCKQDHL